MLMADDIPDFSASQVRWLTREGSPNQLDLLLLAPDPIPRPEAIGFRVGEPPDDPKWTICARPPALAAQLSVVQIRQGGAWTEPVLTWRAAIPKLFAVTVRDH